MFLSAMAQEHTNLAIKDAEGVSEHDRVGKCEYIYYLTNQTFEL